ncbi:MAG: efflux RND transporter periplasmic adaptor subunit [Pseudomonadota bacterium]
MPVRFRPRRLAVLLLFALAACGRSETPADDAAADPAASAATPAMAVTLAPVAEREIARGIGVSGEIAAVEEMQLGVEVTGLRVTELKVDVGAPVRRGQVLLTLDRRMIQSELAQAEAALREAEAGAELARANLARGRNLADQRFISATQLDELRAARTQSEARVGTARAARDAAALRLSYAELRAPADGIVSKRLVQAGQVVGAGTELLRLIRDGRLEWRAELPVAQLAQISPGDRVELRAPDGAPVVGRVRAVSPGVDIATRTGTVFVDLPGDSGLMTGAYVEGRIDTGRARVPTVPASAVVLRDGFPTVFVVDAAGVAHAQRVRIGARSGARSGDAPEPDVLELLEGPKTGARVAVRGAGFLADGDRVRVVDATATPAAPTPASGVR